MLAALVLLPPAGVPVPPAEAPELVGPEVAVFGFFDALEAHDSAAAAGFVAAGADPVALPGLPAGFVPEGAGPEEVAAALAFFDAVIGHDVLGCVASAPVVTCDLRLDSDFARAVHVAGVAEVAFTVAAGQIVGITRSPAAVPAVVGYCTWGRRAAPSELFDGACVPTGAAADHRRLAASYRDAGGVGGQ